MCVQGRNVTHPNRKKKKGKKSEKSRSSKRSRKSAQLYTSCCAPATFSLTRSKIANKGHTTERGAFRERTIVLARDYVDDANGHVTAALKFPRVTNRAHVFKNHGQIPQQIKTTRATPRARVGRCRHLIHRSAEHSKSTVTFYHYSSKPADLGARGRNLPTNQLCSLCVVSRTNKRRLIIYASECVR